MKFARLFACAMTMICCCCQFAAAEHDNKFQSPSILVLGDSQLAFGSGRAFLNFFSNIKSRCQPDSTQKMNLEKLGDMSVGVIGVRSTSLGSWVARKGKAKDKICKVDSK